MSASFDTGLYSDGVDAIRTYRHAVTRVASTLVALFVGCSGASVLGSDLAACALCRTLLLCATQCGSLHVDCHVVCRSMGSSRMTVGQVVDLSMGLLWHVSICTDVRAACDMPVCACVPLTGRALNHTRKHSPDASCVCRHLNCPRAC